MSCHWMYQATCDAFLCSFRSMLDNLRDGSGFVLCSWAGCGCKAAVVTVVVHTVGGSHINKLSLLHLLR